MPQNSSILDVTEKRKTTVVVDPIKIVQNLRRQSTLASKNHLLKHFKTINGKSPMTQKSSSVDIK